MDILQYNDLNPGKVKTQFERTIEQLQASDFRAAAVRKIPQTRFYQAQLDETNGLLFAVGRYDGRRYALLLEIIPSQAYPKSRFLAGTPVDESQWVAIAAETDVDANDVTPLAFVNFRRPTFHLLNKVLSFNDAQGEILHLPLPLVVTGAAGSGKTTLLLEKLKMLSGRVLYIAPSACQAEKAHNLYYAQNYANEQQEVEFLSFPEYLQTVEVPAGIEVTFSLFDQWIWRYRRSHHIRNATLIFEEFKGVIMGSALENPYLSASDYLSLQGPSVFPVLERATVYDLFTRYLDWLRTERVDGQPLYDTNLLAYDYLDRIEPQYDFVVVDDVQDLTAVQLMAVLRSLRYPQQFLLGGDSNRMTHPSYFSWSRLKTWIQKPEQTRNLFRVLPTDYRHTPEITRLVNQLLLVRNARLGTPDKESAYLVRANYESTGEVTLLENIPRIRQELDQKTRRSAKVAVVVLRPEDKIEARRYFQTPLVFSVQEARALSFETVILFNVISDYEPDFWQSTEVGTPAHEQKINVPPAEDAGLEGHQSFVNALYVALTRAVKNLYVLESDPKHPLLLALGLVNFRHNVNVSEQISTRNEWQREAWRLDLQGTQEQADLIRKHVLRVQGVPWDVVTRVGLPQLVKQALDPDQFNRKAKDHLFEYALFYDEQAYFDQLAALGYRPAERWENERVGLLRRIFQEYASDNLKELIIRVQKFGPDFRNSLNLTPFMLAVAHGAGQMVTYLLQNGAQIGLTDNYGHNALRLGLLRAYENGSFKEQMLNRFYDRLKVEPLRVKIGDQLVKVDSHQPEYLMLNLMLAVLRTHLIRRTEDWPNLERNGESPAFQTADFMHFFEGLSEQVVPEHRRQRSYLSSIFAKNEMSRDDKHNKKLFLRLRMGHYVPNPLMQIRVDAEWVNIYDLANLDDIRQNHAQFQLSFLDQIHFARELLAANPHGRVDFKLFHQQQANELRRKLNAPNP